MFFKRIEYFKKYKLSTTKNESQALKKNERNDSSIKRFPPYTENIKYIKNIEYKLTPNMIRT